MNDGEYRPFDPDILKAFTDGYRYILNTIKARAPQARVTVLEPSPYDDFTRPPEFAGGYNAVLLSYGRFVREIGAREGLTVADMNASVTALLKEANSVAPKPAQGLIPDRVHPSPGVHLVMAEALLRAWHAPSVVSAVKIDGSTGAVSIAENTTIDSIGREHGLSWTQLDKSLPMFVETENESVALALQHSDFTDALNREMLTVTGLSAGRYRLSIDDESDGYVRCGATCGGSQSGCPGNANVAAGTDCSRSHLSPQ